MSVAVIPVAGWGTRALPASKSIPKEMFPLFDRPVIQRVVEEAVSAGVTDILFVTGMGKSSIEDHFDTAIDLEWILEKSGKQDILKEIKKISQMVRTHSVRQKDPRGLGHAVSFASGVVQSGHFFVMLGDDVIVADRSSLLQMKDIHAGLSTAERSEAGVVLVTEVPDSEVSKYGICEVDGTRVTRCIEKPNASDTKSRLAIIGRYFLPGSVFEILNRQAPSKNGEIQLTDALNTLAERGHLHVARLNGRRYDAGDRLGWLAANLHFFMKSELRSQTLDLLKEAIK